MELLENLLGWMAAGLALTGTLYALFAAILAGRFMRPAPGEAVPHPAVTLLKPLYRDEPGLQANLESFCTQDYQGPIQIVFGVHDQADPALAAVQTLQARYPHIDIAIVANSAVHGANAKISNLINMLPEAKHGVLVLSDSDIAVPRHWLHEVAASLQQPGVGAVTCLYTGAGDGAWPALSAMGTNYDFLPNVIMGVTLGLADPCMGSTIALRRQTLDAVGGFAAFADFLADDYEIGRAVRARGFGLAIPRLAVTHTAAEATLGQLLRHDLRWTRTIRTVNPAGHLGSVVTHGFPIALIAALLLGFSAPSLALVAAALCARLFLKWRIDAIFGASAGSGWLLPLRDVLSFAVFVTSLFGETVHWREARFSVAPGGAMSQS